MANQKLKMACRALGRAYNDPDNTCNPELGLYIKDVLFELGEAEAESEGNAQRLARQYAEDRGECCGCKYKRLAALADQMAEAVEHKLKCDLAHCGQCDGELRAALAAYRKGKDGK